MPDAFSVWLRDQRQRLGLSQLAMVPALGIHRRTYVRWEAQGTSEEREHLVTLAVKQLVQERTTPPSCATSKDTATATPPEHTEGTQA